MNIEDVVIVSTVREDIRNHALQVDAAEIPRHVEAAQTGKLVHDDSVDAPGPSVVPKNGAVEQAPSPVCEKQAPTNCETDEGDGEVLVSPVAIRTRRSMEDF
jgi:hypothetical protein